MGLFVRGIHSHFMQGHLNAGASAKPTESWDTAILSWPGNLRDIVKKFYSLSKDLSNDWRAFFPSKTPQSSSWTHPAFRLCSDQFQCFKTYGLRIKELEPVPTPDHISDPGEVLWSRVTHIHEVIKELKLDDYRPGAVKELDVDKEFGSSQRCSCTRV